MGEEIDIVIVGAGQAGLALSYYLQKAAREHVLLERSRIAESWRSERWDSLVFQFPNWSISLPGYSFQTDAPDGFAAKEEIVSFVESYAERMGAPVRAGTEVLGLSRRSESGLFLLDTSRGPIHALNVVVATGPYRIPILPNSDTAPPKDVFQIHSQQYRSSSQLPSGGVLIVGSGASGVQIAEELRDAGRAVYLSVGSHDRMPRRYLGKDIYWWFDAVGILAKPLATHPELVGSRMLITGANGGYDLNLSELTGRGVTLTGRFKGIAGSVAHFADDLHATLSRSDAWFQRIRRLIDDHALRIGIDPSETDFSPTQPQFKVAPPLMIDLRKAGIRSIIWSLGYRPDFSWIKLPVLDGQGRLSATRGVSNVSGLYFVGQRRTHSIGSTLLSGVGYDAAHLASHITASHK